MQTIEDKYERLKSLIKEKGSIAVAFSGGVDSSFLLKVASDILGDKVVAATATSPTYPAFEFKEAVNLAKKMNVRHIIFESDELEIPGFSENSPKRCYFCKNELFTILKDKARELGVDHIADGTNCDDLADYRPGREAAIETGVISPLAESGMGKGDIRILSKRLGLPTWNKPAFACLSSRFPYGTEITADRVRMIETCEDLLRGLSFKQFRVRYHGNVARIEVDEGDINRLLSGAVRKTIAHEFKKAGFKYISVDIEGYRTGSMNEAITEKSRSN